MKTSPAIGVRAWAVQTMTEKVQAILLGQPPSSLGSVWTRWAKEPYSVRTFADLVRGLRRQEVRSEAVRGLRWLWYSRFDTYRTGAYRESNPTDTEVIHTAVDRYHRRWIESGGRLLVSMEGGVDDLISRRIKEAVVEGGTVVFDSLWGSLDPSLLNIPEAFEGPLGRANLHRLLAIVTGCPDLKTVRIGGTFLPKGLSWQKFLSIFHWIDWSYYRGKDGLSHFAADHFEGDMRLARETRDLLLGLEAFRRHENGRKISIIQRHRLRDDRRKFMEGLEGFRVAPGDFDDLASDLRGQPLVAYLIHRVPNPTAPAADHRDPPITLEDYWKVDEAMHALCEQERYEAAARLLWEGVKLCWQLGDHAMAASFFYYFDWPLDGLGDLGNTSYAKFASAQEVWLARKPHAHWGKGSPADAHNCAEEACLKGLLARRREGGQLQRSGNLAASLDRLLDCEWHALVLSGGNEDMLDSLGGEIDKNLVAQRG